MSVNMSEKGYLKVKGGHLHFEAGLGDGSPHLLIHPAISDMRIWDREFASNSIGKSLIGFDTRGLGKSTAASSDYFPSDDILALLDHLGIERASLVAASNGGMAAMDFALRFPERVDKMVLLASGIELFEPGGDSTLEGTAQDFIQEFRNVSDAWTVNDRQLCVERLIGMFGARLKGEGLTMARGMILGNLEEIVMEGSAQHQKYVISREGLANITVPTLILVGTSDHPLFMWATGKLQESIKGSRREKVEGADHLINLSAPQDFDLIVGQFLGR